MPTATVDAEIVLRTERMLSKLREIPGITDAEAKKMAGALSKQWAQAEKDAARTAKKMAEDLARADAKIAADFKAALETASREAEQLAQEAQRAVERAAAEAEKVRAKQEADAERGTVAIVKKIAAEFGGEVSALTEVATETEGAIGGIGVAAVGAVGGAVALAAAWKGVVDRAAEAEHRLEAAGLRATIPQDAQDSITAYSSAAGELSTKVDQLTVRVGAELAPALTTAATATSDAIDGLLRLQDTVKDDTTDLGAFVQGLDSFGDALKYVASLGVAGNFFGFDGIIRARDAQRKAADEAIAEQERLAAQNKEFWQGVAQAAEDAADAAEKAWAKELQGYKAQGPTLQDLRDGERKLEEAARKREAALKAEEQERARMVAANEKVLQSERALQKQTDAANAETLGAEAQIEAAYQDREQAIDDAAAAGARASAVQAALNAAEAERQRALDKLAHDRAAAMAEEARQQEQIAQDLDALNRQVDELGRSWIGTGDIVGQTLQVWAQQLQDLLDSPSVQAIGHLAQQWADQITQANEDEIQALQDRHETQLDAFKEERNARRDQIDEWEQGEIEKLKRAKEAGRLSAQEYREELRRIQAAADAQQRAADQTTEHEKTQLDARHRKQQQLAAKAFRENQELQIAQAAIESFQAAVALVPAFAYLGPGAPEAAALIAAESFGLAVQGIQSQSPPEFPMGRSPDHPIVGAIQPEEAVLSRRAVELEGRDRIERANRGQATPTEVHVHLGRRVVATAVADHVGRATLDPRTGKRTPRRR